MCPSLAEYGGEPAGVIIPCGGGDQVYLRDCAITIESILSATIRV